MRGERRHATQPIITLSAVILSFFCSQWQHVLYIIDGKTLRVRRLGLREHVLPGDQRGHVRVPECRDATRRGCLVGVRVMETTEICPLTEDAVGELLARRSGEQRTAKAKGKRKASRWPFPATAELWVPEENGLAHHALGTALNLSLHGVGIRCAEPLAVGVELAIAIHEPEMSFHGRGLVRHCTAIEEDYLVGLEFLFDKA